MSLQYWGDAKAHWFSGSNSSGVGRRWIRHISGFANIPYTGADCWDEPDGSFRAPDLFYLLFTLKIKTNSNITTKMGARVSTDVEIDFVNAAGSDVLNFVAGVEQQVTLPSTVFPVTVPKNHEVNFWFTNSGFDEVVNKFEIVAHVHATSIPI